MNVKQAKEIPVEKVLERMGYLPQKISGYDLWFLSPFTTEKTPSFKINQRINRWYCHSSGFGGNTLDFVVKKSGCSISEALTYLKDFDVFFSFHQQENNFEITEEKKYSITSVSKIKSYALIEYLSHRRIRKSEVINKLSQVNYEINGKSFYAIGFKNDRGGWEIRNKYVKICLNQKDITLIKNNSNKLLVFEGFFDYLSHIQFFDELKNDSDYLILNSISLLKKSESIFLNYTEIDLYLDNDIKGKETTLDLLTKYKNVNDKSDLYAGHKDLNEFLMHNIF
jgi:hypothetical protein